MAILEGAKYPHSESSEITVAENTQTVYLTTDTITNNGKSDLLDDNGNCYRVCIPVVHIGKSVRSYTESVPQSPNVKKVYTVPDDDTPLNASSVCKAEIVENDTQVDEYGSAYKPIISVLKQFVVKTSKTLLNNADSTTTMEANAEVKEINNGLSSDSNNLDIASAGSDNAVPECDRKSPHRKKLYSGRDSPVDLIHIRRSSVNQINKPRKSLHPALDPTVTTTRKQSLLQRRKIIERKRQKWSELISKKLARISSSSQEPQDDSQILSSVSDSKDIIRRSERIKNAHRKEPVLCKYNDLSDSDENRVGKKNLVPTSNGAANNTNLESTEDAEAVKDNLTNSQEEKIPEKHVENGTPIGIKYPVVRLERISPFEIKKHMSNGSSDEETVILPLLNTIELNRRRVTNIQFQGKSLRSKEASCQIQDDDQENLDSDQSTVLLSECKNGVSHECHSVSESSSFINSSPQDISYNMANNSSYNSPSDESQKNKNLKKWIQNDTSYLQARIKIPEVKPANGLRRGSSRGFKEEGKNGLNKEEILEEIKAVEALEPSPREKLRNISRCTRNLFNEKTQNETNDSTLKKPLSIGTNTAQLTKDTSKTDSKKGGFRVQTHAYRSQQFERRRTINPVKGAGSDESELERTEDRNRHRTIAVVSSDEENEFIKLIRNAQSTKGQRTESEAKRNNVTVVNIVDTTDEESDVLINDDNPKSPSEEAGSTVRKAKRSTLRRKSSKSDVALRIKALKRSRTLDKYASSSSEASEGIFTSTRANRKATLPAAISTRETSSSPIMVDSRIPTTVRTPKRNNASPKRSSSEATKKFEHSKGISEKKVRGSVTPIMPATRLRFQTRLYNSDSE